MLSMNNVLQKEAFCILPDSRIAYTWSALALLLLLLQAVFVPYFIAFPDNNHYLSQVLLDAVCVAFYALDIYANLCLFAIVVDGNIVTDHAVFRSIYVKYTLCYDVLSTLPLSLIVFGVTRDILTYRYTRILFLLRLSHILPLLSKCYFGLENLINIKIGVNKLRVAYTLLVILYITHIIACLFSYIGMYELHHTHDGIGWIEANDLSRMSYSFIYLRAYYFALYTVTTVGYGSMNIVTNTERLFALCVMILGSILTAALSAMLSTLVETADKASSNLR